MSTTILPSPFAMTSQESTEHRQDRPFFKRVGAYIYVMLILGVATPIIVYLGVMQSLGWRVPSIGVNGILSYSGGAGGNVILYASPTTETYFAGIGGKYQVLLDPWRAYFKQRGRSYKEISDISQLSKYADGVVVLPSAVALSMQERAAILAFREKGGGVLATWATGTRGEAGAWDGWQFLERLGAKTLGELGDDPNASYLVLNGESPVSYTQPAGFRFSLGKTSEPLLRMQGEAVAGRFMSWARVATEARSKEGAVVYSEPASYVGRAAVFAFAESVWESHPAGAYSLIDDSLRWLLREPAVVLAAWPNEKRAAQVIEMDTEDGFLNALPFADMMHALDYPGTFYVLTSVAKAYPDAVRSLAKNFEIAYHADVHDSFKGQSPEQQEARMLNMKAQLQSILPNISKVTGFRAPTEGYDATTELLLQKNGIRHHAADPNRSEARLPFIAKMEGVDLADALVVLPRGQRDDLNLHWDQLSAEQTTAALNDDFDLVMESGALGFLSIHSQNFKPGNNLFKAMPSFLLHTKLRRKELWVASAGEVAAWWRERERVSVSSSFTGRRLEFNVTVKPGAALKGVQIVLMLPKKNAVPVVASTKTSGLQPKLSPIDAYRTAISFDSLAPGNYSYQVTFNP